jgi:hypothetical protein
MKRYPYKQTSVPKSTLQTKSEIIFGLKFRNLMTVGYGKEANLEENTDSIFYAKSVWELIG